MRQMNHKFYRKANLEIKENIKAVNNKWSKIVKFLENKYQIKVLSINFENSKKLIGKLDWKARKIILILTGACIWSDSKKKCCNKTINRINAWNHCEKWKEHINEVLKTLLDGSLPKNNINLS